MCAALPHPAACAGCYAATRDAAPPLLRDSDLDLGHDVGSKSENYYVEMRMMRKLASNWVCNLPDVQNSVLLEELYESSKIYWIDRLDKRFTLATNTGGKSK